MSGAASHGPAERRASRRERRWRDPQVWRLASGLVLFAFALTHFLNHALGHVSLHAMEAAQTVRVEVWRSWPGTLLLYGAAAVHIGLAFWKLARRRTWRMAPWEAVQIALGLAIPLLVATHVAATRLNSSFYGGDDTYNVILRGLWPDAALKQSLLLVIVWLHAIIGLHFWLRLKPWYASWSPVLLVLAALVPTLAVTGWITGAREAEAAFSGPPLAPAAAERRAVLIGQTETGVWSAFALLVAAMAAVRLGARWRGGPTITYPGGRRVPRRVGGDAARDQPRRRRAACGRVRRQRALHDVPRSRRRGRRHAAAAERHRSRRARPHPRAGGRAPRLPDQAAACADGAAAHPAPRGGCRTPATTRIAGASSAASP